MRNQFEEAKVTDTKNSGFRAATVWLHNTITQKQVAAIERLSSTKQRRALPKPAAEGVLKNLWKLLKYVICIMVTDKHKKLHP